MLCRLLDREAPDQIGERSPILAYYDEMCERSHILTFHHQHPATGARIDSDGLRGSVEGYTAGELTKRTEANERRRMRPRKKGLTMKDLCSSRPVYRRLRPERPKKTGERERGEQADGKTTRGER